MRIRLRDFKRLTWFPGAAIAALTGVPTIACGPTASAFSADAAGSANGTVSTESALTSDADNSGAPLDSSSSAGIDRRTVVAISGGDGWTLCATFDTGEAKCWGRLDDAGSLANIGDDEPASVAPDVALDAVVSSVAPSLWGTCAMTADLVVTCWGNNTWGQLGAPFQDAVGDDEAIGAPIDLGGARAKAIATSSATCVVLEDGRVRCFGDNGTNLFLGLGFTREAGCGGCLPLCCVGDDEAVTSAPVLEFASPAREIVVGTEAICAVLETGVVRCWGYGPSIGLPFVERHGDDELASDGPDVDVGGPVKQISASGPVCAVLVSGQVRCWGWGSRGELGQPVEQHIGITESPSDYPPLPLPAAAVEVRVGKHHGCARLDNGDVHCWGDNAVGQVGHPGIDRLGDDETIDTVGPIDLGGKAIALASSIDSNCALMSTGALRCWGSNEHGELGYGIPENVGDDETPASVGDVPID
jgi:alpha-tubulin suppressor-like RCC1 family protein